MSDLDFDALAEALYAYVMGVLINGEEVVDKMGVPILDENGNQRYKPPCAAVLKECRAIIKDYGGRLPDVVSADPRRRLYEEAERRGLRLTTPDLPPLDEEGDDPATRREIG